MHGLADGGRRQFSLGGMTPRLRRTSMKSRAALGIRLDNFYADGDTKAEGDIWLNGGYPDPVRESGILGAHGNYVASDLQGSSAARRGDIPRLRP